MAYFHVRQDIYLVYYNMKIVALDLRKNRYIIVPESAAQSLQNLLCTNFETNGGNNLKPQGFDYQVRELQKLGVLSAEKYDSPCPKVPKRGKLLTGASNIDWRISSSHIGTTSSKKLLIQAYYQLLKVYFILKVFGFYSLIKSVKKRQSSSFFERNPEDFSALAAALNKACFYFPVKTKCLEWSAALVFMGLARRWKCNLEVGVQLLPFKAHAWVKAGGAIIADNPKLSDELSVILSEPY